MIDSESKKWLNIDASKKEAYCIKNVSKQYFEDHKNWPIVKTIEKLSLRLKRRLKILEAGCGSGGDCVTLALLGHDVTAIDISPSILNTAGKLCQKAKELYPEKGINLKLEMGNIFDLSKYKGQFDLVFNFGVIQIWKEEKLRLAAIQNMKDTLKEEAWIYVAVTNTTNPVLKIFQLDEIISDMAYYNLQMLENELKIYGFETIEKNALGLSDTFEQWIENKYLKQSLIVANAILCRLPTFMKFLLTPHVGILASKTVVS